MTLDDVLRELIGCLGEQGDDIVGWERVRQWPKGAIEIFQKAGWLKAIPPADMVECPGCEENCFMPVQISAASPGQTAAAFVACDTRSEMGKVKIPPAQLQQWQLTQAQIKKAWKSARHNGANKPLAKRQTHGIVNPAAATINSNAYARYGRPGNTRPVNAAPRKNARH